MAISNRWIIIASMAILCRLTLLTEAQLNTPPPCQLGLTEQCTKGAIQAAAATGCNWHIVIPAMQTCLNTALMGCLYEEVIIWNRLVTAYNNTLQLDSCNPSCTNQTLRGNNMQQCFTYSGGQIEDLVRSIYQQPSAASALCPTLSNMNSCLLNSTAGCPALMDIAYNRISVANGTNAYSTCNISPFQPPTTNAPVGLLDTAPLTLPSSTSASTTAAVTIDQGQLIIIILGSIVIAATVILIIILTVLLIRRKQAKANLTSSVVKKEWRPYGAKVYSSLPQETMIRPTQERQIYRPLNYTSNMGFFNEAVQRD